MKYYIFLFTILLSSCQHWLTIQPDTELSKDEQFSTKEGFYDALMGLYMRITDNYNHQGDMTSGAIEHLACQWMTKIDSREEAYSKHNYKNSGVESAMQSMFEKQYKAIANMNIFIEYAKTTDVLSERVRRIYLAEALASRAFIHFDLLRLWGPVPTKVAHSIRYLPYVTRLTTQHYKYHTYSEYTTLMLNDLNRAEEILVEGDEEDKTRWGKHSVRMLKLRVLMWLNQQEEALKLARLLKEEIEADGYALAEFGSTLLFNTEHIWRLSVDMEDKKLSKELKRDIQYIDKLFDNSTNDIRYAWWKIIDVGDNSEYKSVIKFDTGNGMPLIRLAELYFILIELSPLSEANEYYETFCRARQIIFNPLVDELHRDEILIKEYRREFIGEGVLFFYYKRRFVTQMPNKLEICGTTTYVAPIPERETNLIN